jgi:hypothetical protein
MLTAYLRQLVNSKAIFKNKILLRGILFLILLLGLTPLFSQEYGFMYIANGSSPTTVGTSWVDVATFNSVATSTNWSYSSNTLIAANADAVEGLYLVKYSLSFEADEATWSMGISISSSAPTEPIFTRSISSTRVGDVGNMSGSFLVSITKNQTVKMQVKADDAGNSFTPVHAQVAITRVAETSVNYYGGMHISSDQPYAMPNVENTFVKLTGFAAFDELSDWVFSTSELTAGASAAGTYFVVLSMSFSGDEQGSNIADCSFDIRKNGISTNILAVRNTGSADIGNISAAGIISISANDAITVYGAQNVKSLNLTAKKSTLSLYKLVDSSSGSYAGAKITDDRLVIISAANTWTTVGTLTNDATYGWSFSTNVFTPSLQSTSGYHLIDYATSLTTANIEGDVVELGVFIGSKIHPEFTTIRKLSSDTDVGTISGNGIFLVDHIDSTITLKVRNTLTANDLTFKKTYLSSVQIRYVYTDNALPITLNDFTAVQDKSAVKLSWQTASEIDNARFLIYRDDEVIASIEGAGTTAEPHYYSFTDNYVVPGKTYTYVLADISYSNVEVKHKNKAISLTVREGNVSKDYQIGKAYPNPFNPSTVIPVNLAREAQVSAEMYDLAGYKIKSLFDGAMNAGSHKLQVNGGDLSTGVYLVHIKIEGISTIRKISLMK